ncbi:MAG: S8/S53 family peptidase [Candidatus Sericytochromatia bacterium]
MKKSILVSLILSASLVSCENIQKNNLSEKYVGSKDLRISSENTRNPEKDIDCPQERGFSTKSDAEPSPPPAGSSVGVSFEEAGMPESSFFYGKKLNMPYSTANPVPEGVRNGYVSLVFKDEYKIRLRPENGHQDPPGNSSNSNANSNNNNNNAPTHKKFVISVQGSPDLEDEKMNKINNLLKHYKINDVLGGLEGMTEQKALEEEQSLEQEFGYDYSNRGSSYTLVINDSDIKSFVDEMRAFNVVREINLLPEGTSDFSDTDPVKPDIPNNEEIFKDGLNSKFDTASVNTSIGVNEAFRYWYSRINADLAWNLIKTENDATTDPNKKIKPAKIAVIDKGFVTVGDDIPNYVDKTLCTDAGCSSATDAQINDKGTNKYYHGSMVASVIGAPYDTKGIVGLNSYIKSDNVTVMPNVEIVPVNTHSIKDVKIALDYIRNTYNPSHTISPIRVVNISMSVLLATSSYPTGYPKTSEPIENLSQEIRDSIELARDNGILVVITAGNYGDKIGTASGMENITSSALVVGGSARNVNNRWFETGFSTSEEMTGSKWGKRVDITAPAESIILTNGNQDLPPKSYYMNQSGTSFAAPMVSSVASLLFNARDDLKTMNSSSVDKVKNLIVHSGTPINTDYPMGPRREHDFTFKVPNGMMLNMYNALRLALKMNGTNGYVRVFNSDFKTDVTFGYGYAGLEPTEPVAFTANYKEDKIVQIPNGVNNVKFQTYNRSCVYSWGYQIWKNGNVTYTNVQGIAGKMKPSIPFTKNIANNVYNQYLNASNTGVYYNVNGYLYQPNVYVYGGF